ncbi:MAG: VCBS repeat-containing protein [Cytophagales bacterium]|nr:VCBS repeat-containing protein [Cytophagales bacterium]
MWVFLRTTKELVIYLFLLVVLFFGCTHINKPQQGFRLVRSEESGILFTNSITEHDSLHYTIFPYIYGGGGVAIGDLNNDGLSDIYLTGNMVENKLYLNRGDMVFEDISLSAGIVGDTSKWYTGVTMIDINHDGWTDIYLCVAGKNGDNKNELYLNQGDLTFTEHASAFGIDDDSNSIQSTFFDYDKDGDLDLFIANYPLVPLSMGPRFYDQLMKENRIEYSGHLYENSGNDRFEDVTDKAGLRNFGLTLGLVASDLNNDGWVDLYLSNDFNVPDYLYINQKDGTFSNKLQAAIPHTSLFGMGIDIADFNNDGLNDLIQADMTPEDYSRAAINMVNMSRESVRLGLELGHGYQYLQNSLQLHNGIDETGTPHFSDISRFAGMATTDWSWSTMFADLDNDGWKDAYITNGMKRDVNDRDFNQRTNATTFRAAFGKINVLDYPTQPLSNYAFKNTHDYRFVNITEQWGLSHPSFSNGMSYADLNNDGNLDLVINNIDAPVLLFENKGFGNKFLRIGLHGPEFNPMGVGAKVFLRDMVSGEAQFDEFTLTRGYQSSVEPIVHFGLGKSTSKVVLRVIWPDDMVTLDTITAFNRLVNIHHANAFDAPVQPGMKRRTFTKITKDIITCNFQHQEDIYDDYMHEPLLPHKYSELGPGLALADVNNDGFEDFFVGNAKNSQGKLFLQTASGTFLEMEGPWIEDAKYEDTGAQFIDIDMDGDMDLYVVSGGNDHFQADKVFQDRLYLNIDDSFEKSNALPAMPTSGKAVAAYDYDHDGDLDLFIGGRVLPGKYPRSPQSYLLSSNGGKDHNLRFSDATSTVPGLSECGLITSSIWADVDGNGWQDLVLAGEWTSVMIFANDHGKLADESRKYGVNDHVGWWYGLHSLDVEMDGDMDLVVGNLGLNHMYGASAKEPFEVFLNDFDLNGMEDIVLGINKNGRLLPLRGRDCSAIQIPAIRTRYVTHRDFTAANLDDIYGKEKLRDALHFRVNTFAHYWLENDGMGNFIWHQLPNRSQLAPINHILSIDYDGDEYTDLMVSGGLYDSEIRTPRADGSVGLILRNRKGNGFEAVPPSTSGLYMTGKISGVKRISWKDDDVYVLARNQGHTEFILKRDITTGEQ